MEFISNGKSGEFIDWFDTDGDVINASDGGIIFDGGKYYWYGQAMRNRGFGTKGEGGQVTDVGVVMYSSENLTDWKYDGVILAVNNDEESPLCAPMRLNVQKFYLTIKRINTFCGVITSSAPATIALEKAEAKRELQSQIRLRGLTVFSALCVP